MQSDVAPRKSAWLPVSIFFAALTVLYTWPILTAITSRLPSDIGDPGLNTWILWWDAHALPLTDRWWDAPIFFPLRGTFALSETLLGLTPLTTPLQWMGAGAVTAYNAAFALSFFSAGLAAYALAFSLTRRHDAALIAGVAYGFNPYRAAQVPHVQMLVSCWMPLALLALHRFLDRHRRRDLVLLAVAWLLNGLTTGYYLFFFAVLVACWVIWFVRSWRDLAAIAGAIALGSVPLAPLLAGYTARQTAFDVSRSQGEIVFFSADASAIWAASPFAWLASHWTLAPRPEGELYPGAVILAIVAAAAWMAARRRADAPSTESAARRRTRAGLFVAGVITTGLALASWRSGGWNLPIAGRVLSTTHPYKTLTTAIWLLVLSALLHPALAAAWRRRSTAVFYGLAACGMFIFALGPMPHAFGIQVFYEAPYAWLMALPGGHSLRVPARFAMLVVLCLSQGAALAFVRLTGRGASRPLVAGLVTLIALDGWIPRLRTDAVPAPVELSAPASVPVLELPMEDLYSDTGAMLRATTHGHPLVNGYSGYLPPQYRVLQRRMQELDPDALQTLQATGPLLVVINRARDTEGRYRDYAARIPGASLLRETADVAVYALPETVKETGFPAKDR